MDHLNDPQGFRTFLLLITSIYLIVGSFELCRIKNEDCSDGVWQQENTEEKKKKISDSDRQSSLNLYLKVCRPSVSLYYSALVNPEKRRWRWSELQTRSAAYQVSIQSDRPSVCVFAVCVSAGVCVCRCVCLQVCVFAVCVSAGVCVCRCVCLRGCV